MTAPADGDRRPILIAYDGSEHARAAIEHAGDVLRPRRAVVICVWAAVVEALPAAALGMPGPIAIAGGEKLDAVARERAQELADQGAQLARQAGLDAEARAIEASGSAWHGIVRCAEEIDAAVIVTGTRGRSAMAAAFLGSTAQGVLHHAHRPVLVAAQD